MANGNSNAGGSCNAICWIVAVIFGILVAVILHNWADWGWLVSIVVGIIGMLGAGWLLTSYFCDEQRDSAGASATPMHAGGITAAGAGDAAADGSHDDAATADAAHVAGVDPGTPDHAGGITAAGAGEAGADGSHDVGTGTADDGVTQVDPDTPASAGGVTAAGAGITGADASGGGGSDAATPQMFTSAPEGGGDNLKEIKGVGPKLETTLNDLGVYTFAQIAGWGTSDIAWVDERLTFKGRIERDGWVEQAKTLAGGGDTEFSKRVEDGDVY